MGCGATMDGRWRSIEHRSPRATGRNGSGPTARRDGTTFWVLLRFSGRDGEDGHRALANAWCATRSRRECIPDPIRQCVSTRTTRHLHPAPRSSSVECVERATPFTAAPSPRLVDNSYGREHASAERRGAAPAEDGGKKKRRRQGPHPIDPISSERPRGDHVTRRDGESCCLKLDTSRGISGRRAKASLGVVDGEGEVIAGTRHSCRGEATRPNLNERGSAVTPWNRCERRALHPNPDTPSGNTALVYEPGSTPTRSAAPLRRA